MTGEAPSGRQFELRLGEQHAWVVEVGGALREYRSEGRALVEGYRREEMCSGARGQTLVPWPNRIEDGKYRYGGESLQLALTEPEKHNAIHGLLRWSPWEALEHSATHVCFSTVLHPVPGYPFTLRVQTTYRLTGAGLQVTTASQNLSARSCPYGAGAHPYLTVGSLLDETTLRAPGATWYPTNDRGIPTGKQSVEGSDFDFRRGRSLRGLEVDYTFMDLLRDAQGRAWVTLTSGEGRSVSLWFGAQYPFLELFTGDTLAAERRRTSMGVEPMTCPPNAFNTGEGLLTLAPGQSFESTWGICAGPGPTRP